MKVFVNDAEREEIERRAAGLNLSVSAFLRGASIGMDLSSAIDAPAIDHLSRINADMGRLGGLLKLWLATRRGQGATSQELHQLFEDLQATRQAMREAISAVSRKR